MKFQDSNMAEPDIFNQEEDVDIEEEIDSNIETTPLLADLKLITITIECKLHKGINPMVLYHGLNPDDEILGIKHENNIKGSMTCINNLNGQISTSGYAVKKPHEKPSHKNPVKLPKKFSHGDFRNQVTLNIITPGKSINTKIFSNGTIIFTGCKKVEQAETAKTILLKRLEGLSAIIKYEIETPQEGIKRLWKSKISKQLPILIELQKYYNTMGDMNQPIISPLLQIIHHIRNMNLSAVIKEQTIIDQLTVLLTDDVYIRNALYYYLQVISILKLYFPEKELCNLDLQQGNTFNTGIIYILKLIKYQFMNNTYELQPAMFPASLSNISQEKSSYHHPLYSSSIKESLELQSSSIKGNPSYPIRIVMIYHMFNCNYLVNRKSFMEELKTQPGIQYTEYDNINTSSAKASYQVKLGNTTTETVSICCYHSGKVNIISKSFETAYITYQFISNFLKINREKFEIINNISKIDVTSNELPNFVSIGEHNNMSYVLLKKTMVLHNPRNLKILKELELLDKYIGERSSP